jgi:Na+-driven multidrug efflux pump
MMGWTGAAIATAVSAGVGLLLSFRSLYNLLKFDLPIKEFTKQLLAATLMALVVAGARSVTETILPDIPNTVFVVAIVSLGASVYFLALLIISSRFRLIVKANSPLTLPF